MTDAIEWTSTLVNFAGVMYLMYILGRLNEYQRASKSPSATNGRRGHFAAILLIFGRMSLLVQGCFLLGSVWALFTPNPEVERPIMGPVFFIALSLTLDVGWWKVLDHLNAIRDYLLRTDG